MGKASSFYAEISLYCSPDEGLRVGCSAKYCAKIQKCLETAGLKCGAPSAVVAGTRNIHSWVEFSVFSEEFDLMKQVVFACLRRAGVVFEEESFSSAGELHVRLNLANVSVFDK